jgi:UDP-N-acetylglucosamine 4,6-dehydratase/5-epimerase
VAEAIGPSCEHQIVGVRPGEKIHEEMITPSDSANTLDLGEYFAILPSGQGNAMNMGRYLQFRQAKQIEPGFSYNSGTNPDFLTVHQIRHLIRSHIQPEFEVV